MILFIAAMDERRGIADEHGLPWQGKLPTDVKQFRAKTIHGTVLMGYGTYVEFAKPLSDRHNYVATSSTEKLREGFETVHDARAFLSAAHEDIWVIGGAKLFETTLDQADELVLTRVEGDFGCTKFFPEFEESFVLTDKGQEQEENGIKFRFEIWKRR